MPLHDEINVGRSHWSTHVSRQKLNASSSTLNATPSWWPDRARCSPYDNHKSVVMSQTNIAADATTATMATAVCTSRGHRRMARRLDNTSIAGRIEITYAAKGALSLGGTGLKSDITPKNNPIPTSMN